MLNDAWEFNPTFQEQMILAGDLAVGFEKVRIPHTTKNIPLHYCDEQDYQMLCAYRYTFKYEQSWKDKKIVLHFEAVAHEATVYINGEEVVKHSCGYTAFEADLTPHIKFGDNYVIVKVDSRENLNIPPFGQVIDYMTFGGIYRDVWMEIRDTEGIDDVFFYTKEVSKKDAKASVVLSFKGHFDREQVKIVAKIGDLRTINTIVKLKEPDINAELKFNLSNVKLWEIDDPYLYDVEVSVYDEPLTDDFADVTDNTRLIDTFVMRTGFRKTQWTKDGFYLNNTKVRIRGLNRHQSFPYVGYAMPESMQKYDADILKNELGVNAVRTSHYPQSHYFIDRCDELGLLVFTEIPGWQHIGDADWKQQAVNNVTEMIMQYRNHPSIILWGVRINESEDDDNLYIRTNEEAHNLDPSRATGGVRCIKNSHLFEDVYTYNDFVHDGVMPGIEKRSNVTKNSEKAYLVTEYNGHMFPTKAFDSEKMQLEHALRHARVLDAVAKEEGVAGSFGWCMFDYNTHKEFGSGDRICYHGVCDSFRNPKEAASVYAAYGKEDVLTISSSMNAGEYPAATIGDVYAFTNADSVRLYRNDEFVAEFKKEDSPFKYMETSPILIDDFIGDALIKRGMSEKQSALVKQMIKSYSKYGLNNMPIRDKVAAVKLIKEYHMTLEDGIAIFSEFYGGWGGQTPSYRFDAIKDGQVVKSVTREPFAKAKLETQVSHTKLTEKDSYDVALVRVKMTDQNGNILTFANEPLMVSAKGFVQIITPTKDTRDKTPIALSGGMTGIYVKTMGKAGKGTLTIESSMTDPVEIEFTVEA